MLVEKIAIFAQLGGPRWNIAMSFGMEQEAQLVLG